ncbi:MAG: phytanoyl-CoA dioxygenase family protein [Planctomycetota bacterium]|nr:phytanoyl-CoA dioxygenase family protein [Planctomycetota bacterium]
MHATAAVAERLNETLVPDGAFAACNDALEDPAELRRRMRRDGYLFARGLADRDALRRVRREVLELCRKYGWLRTDAPLMDGLYRGGPFPEFGTEYQRLYKELIRLDTFNAFSISMELMTFLEKVVDGIVLAHRRNIARISFPGHAAFTTQPHQDFVHIRGTPETYTAWIPLGDCPRELGGLTVLEGSHDLGFVQHVPAIGAGGAGVPTADLGMRWLAEDFEAGDVLLVHSHTIHAALPNVTADRLRLSVDFRYQRAGEPIEQASMRLHGG